MPQKGDHDASDASKGQGKGNDAPEKAAAAKPDTTTGTDGGKEAKAVAASGKPTGNTSGGPDGHASGGPDGRKGRRRRPGRGNRSGRNGRGSGKPDKAGKSIRRGKPAGGNDGQKDAARASPAGLVPSSQADHPPSATEDSADGTGAHTTDVSDGEPADKPDAQTPDEPGTHPDAGTDTDAGREPEANANAGLGAGDDEVDAGTADDREAAESVTTAQGPVRQQAQEQPPLSLTLPESGPEDFTPRRQPAPGPDRRGICRPRGATGHAAR